VTTAIDNADRIAKALEAVGLEPVRLPCIRVVRSSPEALDTIRTAAPRADWIVCTSRRAVATVWPDGGMPPHPRVAAVGRATADAVVAAGGSVAAVGTGGASAVRDLLRGRVKGQLVVFPHARAADPLTIEMLEREGATVIAVPAYDTVPMSPAHDRVEAVILGSPSAVNGWMSSRDLTGLLVAAIGETTATAIRALGIDPAVVPAKPGVDAVVDALAAHIHRTREESHQ
jgi:uroporphyrinogen-III synthase